MNNTATPVKHRKTRYDLNFKRSAVELWQSSGQSAAVVTELGISDQTLKVWQ
jgi:transposase-like protein